MTNRRSWTAVVAVAMLATPLLAQGPRPMGGPGGGGPGGPGQRLDFLAGYLALTDAQKTQAKTIFDAASSATETLRGQMQTARESLRTAVKSGGADAQIDQLAAAVGVVEGQILGVNSKAESKFYALLTTDQKTKYDNMRRGPGPR